MLVVLALDMCFFVDVAGQARTAACWAAQSDVNNSQNAKGILGTRLA